MMSSKDNNSRNLQTIENIIFGSYFAFERIERRSAKERFFLQMFYSYNYTYHTLKWYSSKHALDVS